jgi:hypothetical protein
MGRPYLECLGPMPVGLGPLIGGSRKPFEPADLPALIAQWDPALGRTESNATVQPVDAPWTTGGAGTAVALGIADPTGGAAAIDLEETGVTNVQRYLTGGIVNGAPGVCTATVYMKKPVGGHDFGMLWLTVANSGVSLNLVTGAYGTTLGTAVVSYSIEAAPNGYWKLTVVFNSTGAPTAARVYAGDVASCAAYVGVVGRKAITAWIAPLDLTIQRRLSALPNQVAAYNVLDLVNAIAAQQAKLDTVLGGVQCPRFDSNLPDGESVAALAVQAATNCLHNGTGSTIWFAGSITETNLAATRFIWCTVGTSVASVGSHMYCPTGGSTNIQWRVVNASGVACVTQPLGAPALNTPFTIIATFDSTRARAWRDGVLVADVAPVGVPSAANPARPFSIGFGSTVRAAGQAVRSMGFTGAVVTTPQRLALQSYLESLLV